MGQFKKIWAQEYYREMNADVSKALKDKDKEIAFYKREVAFYKNELELCRESYSMPDIDEDVSAEIQMLKEGKNARNKKIHKNKKARLKS